MLATHVSKYICCEMSAMHASYCDKCYQLENPEVLATNVGNYNSRKWKCWRYMSAIIILRNAGDNNNSFWRAPQKV